MSAVFKITLHYSLLGFTFNIQVSRTDHVCACQYTVRENWLILSHLRYFLFSGFKTGCDVANLLSTSTTRQCLIIIHETFRSPMRRRCCL